MYKKLLSITVATALAVTMAACGAKTKPAPSESPIYLDVLSTGASSTEAPGTTPNAPGVTFPSEPDTVVSAEPAAEPDSKKLAIRADYETYLTGGYNAEDNMFTSPCSGLTIPDPNVNIVDVNGDGIGDVVVSGASGIRDKQVTEVYYYNDAEATCHCANMNGTLTAVSGNMLIVQSTDHELTQKTETFFSDTYIYTLEGDSANRLYSKSDAVIWDIVGNGDTYEMKSDYYEGDAKLTADAFNEKTIAIFEGAEGVVLYIMNANAIQAVLELMGTGVSATLKH